MCVFCWLFECRRQTRCSREHAALRLPSQSLLRAQGCPSNAGGSKRASVGDCVTLHKAAIAEIAEGKLASRFGALQDCQNDPEPEAEPPAATQCVHRLNSNYSLRAAKVLQTCCAGRMIVDACDVYVVELKLGTASKVTKTLRSMSFMRGCKYYTTCWCVSVRSFQRP